MKSVSGRARSEMSVIHATTPFEAGILRDGDLLETRPDLSDWFTNEYLAQ